MAATAMTSGEEPPSDEALDASFLLLQLLGKGSYGSVYMGQARDTGQLFAIKVITLAEGDEGYSEIRHEIQMLQECTHPNVVRYFGSLLGRSYLWIVMEFCGGGSIRDVLNARGTALTEEAIAVVCREALKGLAYLHGISKVHRDIKCSNILLTVSGQVKLADFGVSAQLTRTMSKRNTFIGTPHWMAPEVIQESRYDGKVDVWALGISVMEMAEFQPPRHAIHPMRVIFMISREPPPQLAQAEAWSSAMHSFVAACLQKNARQRPSAAQLLNYSFVKQATAATTCLADEVERTAEWLAAQRSAAADAEGHTGGSTPVAGSAASTGGAAVKVGPPPGAPAATSPLRGADATVSSAGTFVVHDSWDGGAGAAARREGVQAAVAGSETGGTVSTTTSGPGGSTGRASWAAPAAVAVHGAGGGGPVSAPPQGGTQGKGKAPPKAAPAKAAAAAPSGGSSHRSRSRSGERGAVGLTYGTQAAEEEAVRQWMEDAWSGLDASAAERILASADGACLPFLRACDVPPLALIQADTHGDLAVDVDQEAMAHLAQACAGTGAECTPHPALPDSTQAMLRACPPLLNVARAAAFHAAAAAAAPAVGPARQAHAAAESGLVETLRTVMHL